MPAITFLIGILLGFLLGAFAFSKNFRTATIIFIKTIRQQAKEKAAKKEQELK